MADDQAGEIVFMTGGSLEHESVITADACVFDEDGFMKPEYEAEVRKSFRGDL